MSSRYSEGDYTVVASPVSGAVHFVTPAIPVGSTAYGSRTLCGARPNTAWKLLHDVDASRVRLPGACRNCLAARGRLFD